MSNIYEKKGAFTATIVVAASDSLNPRQANYVCDGTDDDVEIQAALDALPATGGEVALLDGTYLLSDVLVLDSYQTLRGQGRNTILTKSAAWLNTISATGGAGTEKVGIEICHLTIDGTAGGANCWYPIHFTFVDDSKIHDCWFYNSDAGVYLATSDRNEIYDNHFYNSSNEGDIIIDVSLDAIITGNFSDGAYAFVKTNGASQRIVVDGNIVLNADGYAGIVIESTAFYSTVSNNIVSGCLIGIYIGAQYVAVTGNLCHGSDQNGIEVVQPDCVIENNICVLNTYSGIYLVDFFRSIAKGNFCYLNGRHGIHGDRLTDATIGGNTCHSNSQTTNVTYDNILLDNSDYNLIEGNLCRRGVEANQPRYGINVSAANCDKNLVKGNDLYDAGTTANFNDVGTLTHIEDDNRGIEITQVKMYRLVTNNSGGAFAVGDVVSLRAIAAGNEIITPTAISDNRVYGMVAEAIANAASGLVQVKGKTTVMKATNAGGGNIAIGDMLTTEVGVRARKEAATTDPHIAMALEVCNAADCVIDAYIKSPWD